MRKTGWVLGTISRRCFYSLIVILSLLGTSASPTLPVASGSASDSAPSLAGGPGEVPHFPLAADDRWDVRLAPQGMNDGVRVPALILTHVAQADAGIIYVDIDASGPTHDGDSWATAYTDLQDGLDKAASGDEIWVAQGVYTPTNTTGRDATFQLKGGVALYGGFVATETLRIQRDWRAHVTVLSGDLDGNDVTDPNGVVTSTANIAGGNALHVVSGSGMTETAVLDGFTITGGSADDSDPDDRGGGMINEGGSPTLANVTFSGNIALLGGGMYNGPVSAPTLTDVTFSGNAAKGDGGGVFNNDDSDPTLANVTLSGNAAGGNGGGMYNKADSGPTLVNVTFSGNAAGGDGGGMYNNVSAPTLGNCIFWGNTAGVSGAQMYNDHSVPAVTYSLVQGGCPSGATCSNLLTADPLFVRDPDDGGDGWGKGQDDYGDLHLLPASPAVDAGNNLSVTVATDLDGNPRIVNGTVDMGAYERQPDLLYVDADAPGAATGLSWTDAFTEVQSALAGALAGEEIWVAEGVYTPTYRTEPTDARTATFVLTDGVALYGGFGGYGISETLRSQRDWTAHITVLSGDLDGNDVTDPSGVVTDTANITGTNAYHVVIGSGVDGTAVLDGFTVTGGSADGGSAPHHQGGGMFNEGGSPTLTDVTFSGNGASCDDDACYALGGGMYSSGNPTLANVTFGGNIASCTGNSCEAYGGGMYISSSSLTLINVTLSGNIASCTGNSCEAYGGGMFNAASDPTLVNVTFSGNSAHRGGGMYNWGSAPTLVNVTFSGNAAAWYGGGIYNIDMSEPALTNCVLWGNTAGFDGTQVYNANLILSIAIAYSLVEGGCPSGATCSHLLSANPLFVRDPDDNDYGDLRLLPASPAIDAGDNTAVPSDTLDLDADGVISEPLPFDLDGNPRFVDVAGASDTGNGTPPIVDMGAYETVLADLAIVKTLAPALPASGQAITYTLTFSNAGLVTATGVLITDTIPVSVTGTSVVSSGVAITQTSPGYVWAVQDLAPGQGGVITITGVLSDPLPSGTFTNTALITCAEVESDETNNSNSASTTLAPEITAAPLTLAFGDQVVDAGPTISQAVTITNDGTTNLNFTSAVTLTGADAGEFSIVGDTGENPLTPGNTRTIHVSFDPSSAGAKSANLSIQSDDADEPAVDVSLSGVGTPGNDIYLPLVIRNSK